MRLEFQDNGTGISPENLLRVCDPYFTTRTTGNGLGLSVCHSIARKHGGCLDFESKVGQGTIARIYLPARGPDAGRGAAPAAPGVKSGVGAGKRLQILAMDDEPLMCDLLAMMLSHLGHSATTARTGEAALQLHEEAAARGKPFDLVIIDLVNKLGMGGQELMAALRERDPAIVAVVCSGYSDHPIMANHRSFGFSGCLTKPISVEDLKTALREAMELQPRTGSPG